MPRRVAERTRELEDRFLRRAMRLALLTLAGVALDLFARVLLAIASAGSRAAHQFQLMSLCFTEIVFAQMPHCHSMEPETRPSSFIRWRNRNQQRNSMNQRFIAKKMFLLRSRARGCTPVAGASRFEIRPPYPLPASRSRDVFAV